MATPPPPLPTALIQSIIEGYAQGILPAFPFILIPTVFGSMLVPLLILLFALSTPIMRRTSIFILNVLALVLGIVAAAMGVHIMITSILFPFAAKDTLATENLVYTIIFVWMPWFVEAVLLLRVAAVFPRSRLPLLLAFPVALKAARAAAYIIFCIQWRQKQTSLTGPVSIDELPRWLLPTGFFLEVFDNGYISFLFLWRLGRFGKFRTPQTGCVTLNNIKSSHTSRLQKLFWIASTNFIFPLIFGVIQIITFFADSDTRVSECIRLTNTYIAIISTVLATIWSSTTSFREAIQTQADASSQPVLFSLSQRNASESLPPPMKETGENGKRENWDEPGGSVSYGLAF